MISLPSRILQLFRRDRRETEDTGEAGERLAAEWLRREKGFRILARNWRARRDRRLELDIVARDGEALVFVEVKTRAPEALVPGYHAAVTPAKKRSVRRAAKAYVASLAERPRVVRFDVVEVVRGAEATSDRQAVLHFENVPLFGKNYLRGR